MQTDKGPGPYVRTSQPQGALCFAPCVCPNLKRLLAEQIAFGDRNSVSLQREYYIVFVYYFNKLEILIIKKNGGKVKEEMKNFFSM